jgi:hypothetical protein
MRIFLTKYTFALTEEFTLIKQLIDSTIIIAFILLPSLLLLIH